MPADGISESGDQRDAQGAAPGSRRKGTVALLVLTLLLLVTCCGIGLSQMSTVPDVTGMTEEEARASLEKAGFEVTIVSGNDTEGEDAVSPSGQLVVLSQSPEPGDRFLRGTRVSLTLGPASSSSDGADGGSGSADSEDDGSGGLAGTSGSLALPDSDTATDDGYTVVSGVSSSAPDRRPVIPMVGNTEASSAIAVLQNAGYRVTVKYGPSSAGVPEGKVYGQEPGFGSRADRGTLITLWVSTGAPHEDGYEGVPYPGPGN